MRCWLPFLLLASTVVHAVEPPPLPEGVLAAIVFPDLPATLAQAQETAQTIAPGLIADSLLAGRLERFLGAPVDELLAAGPLVLAVVAADPKPHLGWILPTKAPAVVERRQRAAGRSTASFGNLVILASHDGAVAAIRALAPKWPRFRALAGNRPPPLLLVAPERILARYGHWIDLGLGLVPTLLADDEALAPLVPLAIAGLSAGRDLLEDIELLTLRLAVDGGELNGQIVARPVIGSPLARSLARPARSLTPSATAATAATAAASVDANLPDGLVAALVEPFARHGAVPTTAATAALAWSGPVALGLIGDERNRLSGRISHAPGPSPAAGVTATAGDPLARLWTWLGIGFRTDADKTIWRLDPAGRAGLVVPGLAGFDHALEVTDRGLAWGASPPVAEAPLPAGSGSGPGLMATACPYRLTAWYLSARGSLRDEVGATLAERFDRHPLVITGRIGAGRLELSAGLPVEAIAFLTALARVLDATGAHGKEVF